uniref:Uncharacterized protein n=1 Tax=Tetraselmis sp. GSL018 TaxID=582737 RepID=A0A061S0U3_9CHLO|mmetsp:Transcript_913/g.2179  ORF Transcript_913/g.2179 Transcript_913/m.2179 type:complete len:164 (-) Transcript_913:109-600(-)
MLAISQISCPLNSSIRNRSTDRTQAIRGSWRAPVLITVKRKSIAVKSGEKDDTRPQSTKEEEDELPPWVRREREKAAAEKTGDLPFGLYLLFSSFVAIAAVGSVFELVNGNALFGVLQPDNPFWKPILILFSVTGLPTAGFLFYKAVSAANKAADTMDSLDGY